MCFDLKHRAIYLNKSPSPKRLKSLFHETAERLTGIHFFVTDVTTDHQGQRCNFDF